MRTHTDVVYVRLQHQGHTAWGEAALPPYLPETQETVMAFLTNFRKDISSDHPADWFKKLEEDTTANMAAKAALDMALWHLKAQQQHTSIGALLHIAATGTAPAYYTIGICNEEEMKLRIADGLHAGFTHFKLKLNGVNDLETVRRFTAHCTQPFAVDVNQGWEHTEQARVFIEAIKDLPCTLIEQPFKKNKNNKMEVVKGHCPFPLFADESCQTIEDIEKVKNHFDGVNIKLMKCGGITHAVKMIHEAHKQGLLVLIGCMSESSVGCTAAAHLCPLADYVDLDGPYLIENDPFTGMKVEDGRIVQHQLTHLHF